jgi:hypothetical protein
MSIHPGALLAAMDSQRQLVHVTIPFRANQAHVPSQAALTERDASLAVVSRTVQAPPKILRGKFVGPGTDLASLFRDEQSNSVRPGHGANLLKYFLCPP